ncbi:hypothetical protein QO010_003748 [Caulobacter ginsengisoli]|uniref:Exopolysaccharide biosynthesis protein exod n=1 Tax=Caulobacter ginsengisoli TaxID=400775 RepID=A0ABU0IVA9_9CAUL|nr:exopolysaccharide biosynthesis protein [Caulobacter ginsengisoli]MDQ0465955.1 hypothetical protein [Caulobacter ginsengisoli]
MPTEALHLSAMLADLAEDRDGPISLGEIIDHFGPRAFGAVLFVFAIPNLLPLPPGSTTVLGMPLLIAAPQLALGSRKPWIPRFLTRRTIEARTLASACRRAIPWIERVERLTEPRLGFMFGRAGDIAIGAVCTLLAAVLILPIPLGNMLPAAAVAALSLSLVQRDGLLTLIGYLIAATSAGVLVLSGHIVWRAVEKLGSMVGLW